MPSFANHSRNPTWPPSVLLSDGSLVNSSPKAPSHTHGLSSIDEDPYAHFISPISEEDDPMDALSLSAGIIAPESSYNKDEADSENRPSKLRASVARKLAYYVTRHYDEQQGGSFFPDDSPPPELTGYADLDLPLLDSDSDLDDSASPPESPTYSNPTPLNYKLILREPTRGAAQDLFFPPYPPSPQTYRHGTSKRRATRTLSGLRHSWRPPSIELFTVLEEQEEGEQLEETNTEEKVTDAGFDPSQRPLPVIKVTQHFDEDTNQADESAGLRLPHLPSAWTPKPIFKRVRFAQFTVDITPNAVRKRCPWRAKL